VMGGGCLPNCPWEQGLAVDDVAFIIDRSQLPDWINDIKKIIHFDLQDNGKAPDRWARFTLCTWVGRRAWQVQRAHVCETCVPVCMGNSCIQLCCEGCMVDNVSKMSLHVSEDPAKCFECTPLF
jgi:hypothetical protein